MLKAILFDAGGTLFRLRGSVGEIYSAHAARHGVSSEATILEDRFLAAFRAAPPLAFPAAAADELAGLELGWWRGIVRQVFHDTRFADFETFFHQLFDYFADASAWQLFADAIPTLVALKERGVATAIVSNFDSRLFAICAGLGLGRYVDVIVASSRAGAAKPAAAIFHDAVARLGVDPGDALHVGDNLREDVLGAQTAGLRSKLVAREAVDGDDENVVRDLRQLIVLSR